MTTTTHVVAALVAIAFLAASAADAQIVRSHGLSTAVTWSNAHSPDVNIPGGPALGFDTQRRIGVGIAGFVEWSAAGALSIVTELGYTQRGYQTETEIRDAQNNPVGTDTIGERMDFFALDAALKFRRPMAGLTPYVLAGPEFRVNIGGDGALTDVQSPTAFGVMSGLGVEIPTSTRVGLQAEIRYAADITNSLPDVPRDLYHNAIDLRVGVRF